jgi:hypothetical protein
VNVLSEPTLAVSEGHRPANSRPADPTREYEPGSGDSHDPAPVHRPHPPRPPPPVRRPRRAGQDRRPPLRPQGCFASRCARRPAAAPDPGASAGRRGRQSGQATACPSHGARPPGTSVCSPAYRRDGEGISSRRPCGDQKKSTSEYKQDKRPAGQEQRLDRLFHMSIHLGGTECDWWHRFRVMLFVSSDRGLLACSDGVWPAGARSAVREV